MTEAFGVRRYLRVVAGVGFLLASLYGLMGFLQAASLYTGERALKNANIWSSVFLGAVGLAAVCFTFRRESGMCSAGSPTTGHWAFAGCCFVISTAAAWRVASDYVDMDSCLDLGGSFNYVLSTCDNAGSHAAMSLFAWRGFFLTAALVFAAPVVAFGVRLCRAQGGANAT